MLGMTSVAARQHLGGLAQSGYVTPKSLPPEGRGRPATVWTLTEKANDIFPERHAELTVGLLEAMRKAVGEEGVKRIVEVRAADQVEQYRRTIPDERATLRKRVEALAHLRTTEGYMAEPREESPGVWLLIEHHCPICDAAKCCTGLCDAELDVFRRTLGDDVSIERVEYALGGDRRCTYRITPRD
jgi:predicted ArsR family transcriptional regulator